MGSDCTACPLHRNALTVCVEGRGPTNATVLIVGAKPGQEENLSGDSFTGKSSKLLDLILADAGFDPATVRLTYAVRCITPDRPPTPTEIAACRRYLIEEINAMSPRATRTAGLIAVISSRR